VREVWARIEAALRATAPDLLAALPPGASPEAVVATERRLGVEFPADVRESFAIHDGSGGAHTESGVDLLPHDAYGLIGVPMLSLAECVSDWESWLEASEGGRFDDSRANPSGPIRRKWWCRGWVPVTWDGGGDHLCIDLDPAPGGVLGQVIYFSHEEGPLEVVALSWRTYLEEYAADLQAERLWFECGKLVAAEQRHT
jgi:cell wall assembly regulator SMI1